MEKRQINFKKKILSFGLCNFNKFILTMQRNALPFSFYLLPFIFFHSITFSYSLSAQTKADSLRQILTGEIHDTVKINTQNDLGDYYKNLKPDSALYYFNLALSISEKNSETNPEISELYKNLQAKSLNSIGVIYLNKGDYANALSFFEKSVDIRTVISDKKGLSSCYNNLGNLFRMQGNYATAIEYFHKALGLKEELKDKKGVATCYNNLANVFTNQADYPGAIEWYQKALKIYEAAGDKRNIAKTFNNIGVVHFNSGNFTQSLDYWNKALAVFSGLNDKSEMTKINNNIGALYDQNMDYLKAVEYYKKALKLNEETNDKSEAVRIYGNIGTSYLNLKNYLLANNYYKKMLALATVLNSRLDIAMSLQSLALLNNRTKNYKEAVQYSLQSLSIAKDIGALKEERDSYKYLFDAYSGLKDFTNALKYHVLFKSTEDSIFTAEKFEKLTEIETRYQVEKRKLQIEKLEKQKELDNQVIITQQAVNKKQRILVISFISGFILIFFFSVILYRLFLQKKKANFILALQKKEISRQRDVVTKQKEQIEEIHKDLTDSIDYAKRIQEAVLPVSDTARAILGDHFILFKPKDVVSGDFYWTTKIKQWLIMTVADCTGHGVPGAFMSMLGISFLNEIVRKQEVTQANHVLNHLREEIVNALQQTGSFEDQKDGMDMAFVAINTDTNELQYAGANNPLWVVETYGCASLQPTLKEIKADKMPVAIHAHMNEFTNHVIKVEKGDIIYMSSDGYEDQFGGSTPGGRKFFSKNLKKILLENCTLPMKEQKEILDKTIEDWRNGYEEKFEQTDDITVMGIKI